MVKILTFFSALLLSWQPISFNFSVNKKPKKSPNHHHQTHMQAQERDSGYDVSQIYLTLEEINVSVSFSMSLRWQLQSDPGIFILIHIGCIETGIWTELHFLGCSGCKKWSLVLCGDWLSWGSAPLCCRKTSVSEKEIQRHSKVLSQVKLLLVQISSMVLFSILVFFYWTYLCLATFWIANVLNSPIFCNVTSFILLYHIIPYKR